jgi:hypothetical protein
MKKVQHVTKLLKDQRTTMPATLMGAVDSTSAMTTNSLDNGPAATAAPDDSTRRQVGAERCR